MRFLCTQKREDYKRALPCLVKQDAAVRSRCENQTSRVFSIVNSAQGLRNLPLALRPSILELYCSLTAQYMDCTVPAIKAICGEEPANLMKQVQDMSLNRFIVFLRNPLQSPVPDSCRRLIERADAVSADLRPYLAVLDPSSSTTVSSSSPILINGLPADVEGDLPSTPYHNTTHNATLNETLTGNSAAGGNLQSSSVISSAILVVIMCYYFFA